MRRTNKAFGSDVFTALDGLCAIFYVQKGACPQIAHYQALCDLNGKIYAFSHRNLQGQISESKCFVT